MKASAEKSSSTVSRTTASQPFFAKAGSGSFFAPVNRAAVPAVQAKMTVGKTGDKFEREADKMADKVMRMPSPASSAKEEKIQRKTDEKSQKKENEKLQKAPAEEKIQKKDDDKIRKAPAREEKLQRKSNDAAPAVSSTMQSAIRSKASGGGQPLSADVRRDMEGRFNADFSQVRVHSDASAGKLSNQLSARAFTHRNHIFFSRNQYQPGTSEGKQLLAHELTHTIQQGHAVQRSPQVSTTVTPPTVQRLLGIDIPSWQDVLNWLADKAYNIPGYRMFTIVIGSNPINGASADRSAANILRAIVEFLPGGKVITDALQKYGVFEKAGSWIEGKLKRFENLLETVKLAVSKFMKDLDFIDVILHPVRTWEKAVNIFKNPVDQIISFIGGIFQDIFQFIRDAVLMPLAALAQGKPGFDLLCAILGKNPITKEVVPRTPDTLIGGFMKLIGQEEVWGNIKKGNAIQKAWKWFNNSLQELLAIVTQFPDDFIAMLKSLEVMDFIVLPSLFIKVLKVFGNFVVKFTSWGLNTVLSLLEILVSVVRPTVMPYIKKAQASFVTIIKNPVGFVGNLVKAGKQGFELFKNKIGEYLKEALIKWLVGPLAEAGVYIPQSFQLMEIIKLVLSVLGLTWQNIRAKLVKIIPDPVLAGLEKTASILVTLVKDGPAAAWEQIKAELTELKDQLIGQVTEMISTEVVKAAVTKLVSMLNPAGAVIQAIIAVWNTVSFFIEKANQIGAVVASFIDSISAIAAGQVAPAAKRVEKTLANTLVVVIGFLAKFAGLGNIPTKLVGIVKKVRKPIDKGLDKIVAWLGNMLKNMASRVLGGNPNAPAAERVANGLREAVPVVNRYAGRRVGAVILRPLLMPIKLRHRLSRLDVVPQGNVWSVEAAGSAKGTTKTNAVVDEKVKSTLPDQVDILSGSTVVVQNYSRSARTGILQPGIFSNTVTLNKLKHAPQSGQTGEQIIDVSSSISVEYTIKAANKSYPPPTDITAVDRSNEAENENYKGQRDAFPKARQEWFNWFKTVPEESEEGKKIKELKKAGLVEIDSNIFAEGEQKWSFIHRRLAPEEKAKLTDPVNKKNMSVLLDNLPSPRRDEIVTEWKQHWAKGTQIHHIKPLNFGGDNSNFIPLSAEKHVGGSGVHPRFWKPLKQFLMSLR